MAASLELTRHPIARARATMVAGMAVADTTALREVEAIAEALVRILYLLLSVPDD